jgi:DNA-binding Lrp family transcriptional regulator
MEKPKLKKVPFSSSSKPKPPLTAAPLLRYIGGAMPSATVPHTIHAPEEGLSLLSDRAYIMINVLPGQTSSVVQALAQIKEIKTIDPCWGKPDIIAVAEVADQNALTKLVLSRLHGIEGVVQTDTHMVYKLTESPPR